VKKSKHEALELQIFEKSREFPGKVKIHDEIHARGRFTKKSRRGAKSHKIREKSRRLATLVRN
jgi:hypothetical protein